MSYIPTIGVEVHVELKTKTKIFSNSRNGYGQMANSLTNVVDLAYPGTLPTLNEEVINLAIRAATVLNCKIRKVMHFDRKNYFYPDISKNYQITQNDTPIGYDGYVEITKENGEKKKVFIEEMHIEEDTCKSAHRGTKTLLDFNRAGVPLIEIVTKPCMDSGEDVKLYLEKLRELLSFGDISDCKIEEGSMRADVNVSIRKKESDPLGVKAEIKNIGSISNAKLGVEKEIERQTKLYDNGETFKPQTRRFDDKIGDTVLMRVKETGNDYRYFPEPDIPYVIITDEMIEEVINSLPTNANIRRKKYLNSGISSINVDKIIANKEVSDYLENLSDVNLKTASNLLLGDISAYLNKHNKTIFETNLTIDKMKDLVTKLDSGIISNKNFKDIVDDILESDENLDVILEKNNIKNVVDNQVVLDLINMVMENNAKVVNEYLNGNERSFKYLMGQVMKESKGTVNPSLASSLLEKLLSEKK